LKVKRLNKEPHFWLFILFMLAYSVLGCSGSTSPTPHYATTTPYSPPECDLISEEELERISELSLVISNVGTPSPEMAFCTFYWSNDSARHISFLRTTYDSVDEAVLEMRDVQRIMSAPVPYATNPVFQSRELKFEPVPNLGDEAYILYETITVNDNKISKGVLWVRDEIYVLEISYDVFLPTEQDVLEKTQAIAESLISAES
jgi:hypothetical protein